MLKIIFSIGVFMLASVAEAASISTHKNIYPTGGAITVTVSDMSGDSEDWIGIYPAGASNDWANVITWKWAGGIIKGDVILDSLPNAGNYEARAFFNNSFITEDSTAFAVSDATLSIQKTNYSEGESIVVSLSNMLGNDEDWVGIYPKDATNAWGNVISWQWTGGITQGDITLSGIPNTGHYEARAFFNNGFNTVASDTFTVGNSTMISTQKEIYNKGEAITVSVANMSGDAQDWIGIYPVGTTNDWGNMISWEWTGGITQGDITLHGGVPSDGNYEARAFFNNSFHTEAIASFTVGETFWEKGKYNVTHKKINDNATVYYPTQLNGKLAPVVFFAQGATNPHEQYPTLLNFIASHGYYAVFVDIKNYKKPKSHITERYVAAITALKNQGHNPDTTKIGVVGHSSGGGNAFGILDKLKDIHLYGANGSFLLAIDPWFAFEMYQDDLKTLPNNSNIVILQFGEKGNNKKDDFAGDYTTDALFPLTIYGYLKENYSTNIDYQVFEGVGKRGHSYIKDESVNEGVKGENYAQMKGALNPLGALMALTFEGNEAARNTALNRGSDTPVDDDLQKVEGYDYYRFKCDYGIDIDDKTDIDYCADNDNRNNIPNL